MAGYNNSATASSNTTVGGIGAAGSSDAANIDNLVRELAAQIKQMQLDLAGANTVGGSADAITLTAAGGSVTALYDGLEIGFVATNDNATTTPTLNLSSLGAKVIKKALSSTGAEAAIAAGDIQSGGLYRVRYRSAWDSASGAWQLINLNTTDNIILPSGGVINWNSGDVTITHSSNLLTGAGGPLYWTWNSAATPAMYSVNLTDNASVATHFFDGDRGTPTDGDAAFFNMRLSDDGGTQTTFARQTWIATDVSDTTEDGQLSWSVMKAGTLTEVMTLDATNGLTFKNSTPGLKAFVRFNGTGTPAIAGSFNVSSITDNGTGDYTINFTTALADTNYTVVATSKAANSTTAGRQYAPVACAYATGSVRILTGGPAGGGDTDWAAADHALINVVVYGT